MRGSLEAGRSRWRRISKSTRGGRSGRRRKGRRLQSFRARFFRHLGVVDDGGGDGHHGAASCLRWLRGFDGVIHGDSWRRRKRTEEEEEKALEGKSGGVALGASPRRDKDAWEASRQAGGVAVARLARWHSTEQLGGAGRGRRTPCPWWAGWAGWDAFALGER